MISGNVFRVLVAAVVLAVFGIALINDGRWFEVVVNPTTQVLGEDAGQVANETGELLNDAQQGEAPKVVPPVVSSPGEVGEVSVAASAALQTLQGIPEPSNKRFEPFDRGKHFGSWIDPDKSDGWSCDSRQVVLGRDLVNVTYRDSHNCKVDSGVLNDPYTGKTIQFQFGPDTSDDVQIDHIVALSWAWGQGAWSWDKPKRVQFANDVNNNLWAVDGPENVRKSDKGPSEWLPPNDAFACTYTAQFVQVVGMYGLSMPESDRAAATRVLEQCK